MTKVSPRDVSGSFNQIFDWIFQWLKWCFDTLDSISFKGITLLDFSIWVFVLGIILPIIVTLLNAGQSSSHSYYLRERSAARSVATYQRHEAQREAKRAAQRYKRKGG